MRMGIAVLAAATLGLAAGGCGEDEPEPFTVTGAVSITSLGGGISTFNPDVDSEDRDYLDNPSGAGPGTRCDGGDALPDFQAGDEVVVEDADGSRVGVGQLSDGTISDDYDPEATIPIVQCTLQFEVDDVPGGDGIFVARIGDQEVSFRQSEAESVEFEVTDPPS